MSSANLNHAIPPLPATAAVPHTSQTAPGALNTPRAETAADLDALLPAILDHAFKGEL
jgi:hypothetical protein